MISGAVLLGMGLVLVMVSVATLCAETLRDKSNPDVFVLAIVILVAGATMVVCAFDIRTHAIQCEVKPEGRYKWQ